MKINFQQKIFNDPVYGFISIPSKECFEIIEHAYFQRLRRIKQLGSSHLVYPGALHTRFHHALGAMHLMYQAILVLRAKGHDISDSELNSACLAILLHDVGHGPYSHSLEYILAPDMHHESLSTLFMHHFNKEHSGMLNEAIEIFEGKHPKKFLHQLVSSQLDVDRLDYLKRDSFYTGVSEGVISTDRIISMFNVVNNELAVEVKGIYSIEKFLIARRLMYWQVYLHKTVVSSEKLLINIMRRAKELAKSGSDLFASKALRFFLYNELTLEEIKEDPKVIKEFAKLDDNDVFISIKEWMDHEDKVLSTLATNFVNRRLFKIKLQDVPFDIDQVNELKEKFKSKLEVSGEELNYFIFTGAIENNTYNPRFERINILLRNGKVVDVTEAADKSSVSALSEPVEKHFLCHPKIVS